MKRIIAMILILTALLSFSSCMADTVKEEPNEPEIIIPQEDIDTITQELPKKRDIKAAIFWYDYSDAFLSTVREALNTELDKLGVEYTNYDAGKSQIEQISQINDAITSGVDVLIVNIVDTASSEMQQSIVNIAKMVNKPIIFFNREVYDEVINSYENACFVGVSHEEASKTQGTMVGRYIVENYDEVDLNGDGKISYIMMKGELGGVESEFRPITIIIDSCNAELTAAGKSELTYYDPNNTVKYQLTDWAKDKAFEQMSTALSTNPIDGDNPIEVVICNNDDAALGCVDALNNIGWNTGEPDSPSIPVFGMDYTAEAQTAIKAGKMTGSILQSADGMAETIATLVENVMNNVNVFDSANDIFNVDDGVNKIRVPYEIKLKEAN